MLAQVGLTYSIISGILSILLILHSIKNKSEKMFLFSLLFLIVSWSGIEWSLWTNKYNLFEMVFEPIVPLASYFVSWTVFTIYLSEKYFRRRDWVFFLIVVLFIIAISSFCMNCL